MATSTIFTGFNQPVEDRSLILILNDIKAGKYRAEVERIRSCIASGDTEKADQLKSSSRPLLLLVRMTVDEKPTSSNNTAALCISISTNFLPSNWMK